MTVFPLYSGARGAQTSANPDQITAGVEGEQKLLSLGVHGEVLVFLQECLDRFPRTWTEFGLHGVPVDVRVLRDT